MTVANQPPSYPGNGPFIFVSYSHKDSDRVYPDIAALQAEGISVWYDEGLEPGERWYADVAKHMAMENCRGTVIYASDEFLISDACQKELGYVLDGEKPYLTIKLTDGDVLDQVDALFSQAKINRTARRTLEDVFDKDITFLTYTADNHISKAAECIRDKWGYSDAAEFFPCCNVLHNGHITYFPALAAATPFNYTYFVASNKQHVAASLNGMYGMDSRWKEYPLHVMCTEDIDPHCGVIVPIAPSQLNRLHEILDNRRAKAPGAPLIVNVWSADGAQSAWEALRQAMPAVNAWRESHNICTDDPWSDGTDTYFLCQTEAKTARQIQPGDIVLSGENKLERWRILLSDSAYYEFVADVLARDLQTVKGAKWLLSQQPLSLDNYDLHELARASLEGDDALVQRYDRDAFRVCRFEWEDA